MKDKKYKHIEDLLEDYLQVKEEHLEISLLFSKAVEKQESFRSDYQGSTIKTSEAQEGFKSFLQLKKFEERKKELDSEIEEIEAILNEFLQPLNESRISYEKKDDNKNKMTFLFWLEEGQLKSNKL
jgi:hypothetical protein